MIRTQKEIIKRRRGANFFLQVKEKQKTSKEDIEEIVLKNDKVLAQLNGNNPKKIIVVPKKIINIVV